MTEALAPELWTDLLRDHLDRYPLAEADDVYKLLHQAALGIGHLLDPDPAEVVERIAQELRGIDLTPREHEDVTEPIHPTRPLVRVHLRPYVRAGGSAAHLADAMRRTAATFGPPDLHHLAALLGAARPILRKLRPQGFDHGAFDALLRDAATAGFPARSHSESYRAAYDPRYRVILLDDVQ